VTDPRHRELLEPQLSLFTGLDPPDEKGAPKVDETSGAPGDLEGQAEDSRIVGPGAPMGNPRHPWTVRGPTALNELLAVPPVPPVDCPDLDPAAVLEQLLDGMQLGPEERSLAEVLHRRIVSPTDRRSWLVLALVICKGSAQLLGEVLHSGRHDGRRKEARDLLFLGLHERTGESWSRIARIFGVDHTTVQAGARVALRRRIRVLEGRTTDEAEGPSVDLRTAPAPAPSGARAAGERFVELEAREEDPPGVGFG
jgi:hypothetical protein